MGFRRVFETMFAGVGVYAVAAVLSAACGAANGDDLPVGSAAPVASSAPTGQAKIADSGSSVSDGANAQSSSSSSTSTSSGALVDAIVNPVREASAQVPPTPACEKWVETTVNCGGRSAIGGFTAYWAEFDVSNLTPVQIARSVFFGHPTPLIMSTLPANTTMVPVYMSAIAAGKAYILCGHDQAGVDQDTVTMYTPVPAN